jgi:hypothetical protein
VLGRDNSRNGGLGSGLYWRYDPVSADEDPEAFVERVRRGDYTGGLGNITSRGPPEWTTWMLGIFSAVIILMLGYVTTQLGDLREFKGTMSTMQAQISSIQSQESATQGQVIALQQEVTVLVNRIMAAPDRGTQRRP